MALTYTLNKTPGKKLVFKRERSYFTTIVAIAGGLIFAFGGLAIPLVAFKVLAFLAGIGFSAAAIYVPSLNDRFVPEQATFELVDQSITFEMTNGSSCQIPMSHVKEFVIDTEKRSPSAANSVGIHYLHHHINLIRTNGGSWTITTTTDANEANGVCKMLNELVDQSSLDDSPMTFKNSDKVKIETGDPIHLSWEEKKYGLSIGREKIIYTEPKTIRSFSLTSFKNVRYSFSGNIKNRNWTITIVFGELPQESLNLFYRELNPVQCLELERWLHQTIQKKLSQ
jgi:hypothetical protein